MTPEQRHQLRQQLAPPILAGIKEQLEKHPQTLPNSPMSKAVRYALNEWEALVAYLNTFLHRCGMAV